MYYFLSLNFCVKGIIVRVGIVVIFLFVVVEMFVFDNIFCFLIMSFMLYSLIYVYFEGFLVYVIIEFK